ncbi:MAG: hypothetical protein A3H27_17885 [Acidobacteria bacterium RIFCSPLOWO2_02_FULL_59_13]|nr:MAG: hypothetical protein A3H27_17885 [Acidobacteria bacterium RIFCSPLOWO2_02_FULL_59_13]
MIRRSVLYSFVLLLLVGVGITIAGDDAQRRYLSSEKEFYLTEAELAWLRPGLNLRIQNVEISGSTVTATFRISDDQDQPLDRLGIETPGTVSTSFLLARIKPGETQYSNYVVRNVSSTISGQSATQASTDSGGSYASLGNGVYKYTFGTKLPAGYEADATHTVGMYAVRDVRVLAEELGLTKLATTGRYVANWVYTYVPSGVYGPSGNELPQVRDVVRTEACNQCHDPLALHGGSRRNVQLCILCHQPQTTDPDTGNTVDFKVMIHKIHRGANLPSVRAGTPYQIIGYQQSVHDYSEIHWPQDVRNCTTCHQQGTQSDNWKTNPSRVACGSCHDDVDFATGNNHPGGVQVDDSRCNICHPADGQEFDLSVAGVHTIPAFSKQLKGLNVEITGITNTSPGSKPTVTFTVKDNAGNPIDISPSAGRLDSLVLRLAGPTTDYTWNASENVVTTTASSATTTSTGYSYTFKTKSLPTDAKGSYAVGAEFYNDGVPLAGSLLGQSFTAEETGMNPILYFSVDGSPVQERRQVVDVDAKCNVCHKSLRMHHGNRLNTSYCIMCHNPAAVDNPDGARANNRKPLPPEGEVPTSINLKFMIHRIHSGAELSRDFTVYRTRGVYNFNEIEFPGDRRNCAKCHVNNSHLLPLPAGVANTLAPREFYSPLGPAASACLGCHDSQAAAAHAFLQTAPFGESCAACHGEGKEFSVSRVHAR